MGHDSRRRKGTMRMKEMMGKMGLMGKMGKVPTY